MAEQEAATKICPYCAEVVKQEAVKCRYCGSDLTLPPGQVVFNASGVVPLDHSFTGSLEAGTILFNKYKILELIGQGGMGCVYRAREIDFEVDRTVAIKVLPPNFLQDDRLARRFEEEIKIAAKMDHPNIVPIYNIGRQGNLLFFVMKYLQGSTLKQVTRTKSPLAEDFIRDTAGQIAEAIEYIHRNGTIHRDIKTNNIIVDESGHATLMDFGIAKAGGSTVLTTSGEILGTAPYMSPEQWTGQIDHRSDIYSFGVVLYEMATGHLPFMCEKLPELMQAILNDPAPPIARERPDLSAEFCQLVDRCLQKKADDRFMSMDDVRNILLRKPASAKTPTTLADSDDITIMDARMAEVPAPQSPQAPADIPKLPRSITSIIKRPIFFVPVGVVILLILFFILMPVAAPYTTSLVLEDLGDASISMGMYSSPPIINAYSLYDSARQLRRNKDPLQAKQNSIVNTYANLGKSAFQGGRYETAVKYFKKAMKLHPWDPEVIKEYNKALAKKNETKK